MTKKKTFIEDIERTLYDIRNEDRPVYKAKQGLTEEIIRMGRAAFGDYIGGHMLFALADHLSFALRRASEGITIAYPLQWEVAALYPQEVGFARSILALVEERTGAFSGCGAVSRFGTMPMTCWNTARALCNWPSAVARLARAAESRDSA